MRSEGFFIDNVTIGFVERGQMATQAPANTTDFNFLTAQQANSGSAGNRQHRLLPASDPQRSDYGSWPDPNTGALDLVRAINTNDRLDDSYSLTVPSANDIAQGQTFTVSDGVTSVTFQFVDQSISTGTNADAVPVYFSSGQTAADIAASVVTAINDLNMTGVFNVSAATNGTSNIVSLFGAAKVTGLLADTAGETKVTIPAGSEIVNGSIVTVNDGTNQFPLQFVDPSLGASTVGTIQINYASTDSAATIAAQIIDGVNYYNSTGQTNMTAAADPLDDRVVILTGVVQHHGTTHRRKGHPVHRQGRRKPGLRPGTDHPQRQQDHLLLGLRRRAQHRLGRRRHVRHDDRRAASRSHRAAAGSQYPGHGARRHRREQRHRLQWQRRHQHSGRYDAGRRVDRGGALRPDRQQYDLRRWNLPAPTSTLYAHRPLGRHLV